jgi:hypothetical protein
MPWSTTYQALIGKIADSINRLPSYMGGRLQERERENKSRGSRVANVWWDR